MVSKNFGAPSGRRFAVLLFVFSSFVLPTAGAETSAIFELGPIFSVRAGVYAENAGPWAFRATIGSSAGLPALTGAATALYQLNRPWIGARWSLEGGVPLVVASFIEGRYVDWDKNIENSFYGFVTGGGASAMWTLSSGRRVGVLFAAGVYVEWQEGGQTNICPVPLATLRFLPKRRPKKKPPH